MSSSRLAFSSCSTRSLVSSISKALHTARRSSFSPSIRPLLPTFLSALLASAALGGRQFQAVKAELIFTPSSERLSLRIAAQFLQRGICFFDNGILHRYPPAFCIVVRGKETRPSQDTRILRVYDAGELRQLDRMYFETVAQQSTIMDLKCPKCRVKPLAGQQAVRKEEDDPARVEVGEVVPRPTPSRYMRAQ